MSRSPARSFALLALSTVALSGTPALGENLALNRPAKQSSTSTWSHAKDAQGGVDGVKNGRFGFHTNLEANPWWQVDLGTVCLLDEVRVFNRLDANRERARTLRVLLSSDGGTWRTVYTHDGSVFGGTDGHPLSVKLRGQTAHFVRLQLNEKTYLHLDEVEVLGSRSVDGPVRAVTPVPPVTRYWRRTSITVSDSYRTPDPWHGSVACSSCVTYSWDVQRNPVTRLSTRRAMCADCWGLKNGTQWTGSAEWTLLPETLKEDQVVPISLTVVGGEVSWLWVLDGKVTAAPGQTVKKTFDFKAPHHGAYAEFSRPTLTFPLGFSASLANAQGQVTRGDPSVTVNFNYEWVER